MLFVGAMIPFIFSSLAIAAVGRAAMDMVKEVRRQFKEIPGIMDRTGRPEYERCVEISTKASIREMVAPGAIALLSPVVVGFLFGPEALGGLLAGITVSGVLMGIFQNNAGGAWDNAKKSFEAGVEIDGKIEYKGSEPHKASVTGDTVGDPFKDTSGPSMNILIKLTSIVALIIAPHINQGGQAAEMKEQLEQSGGQVNEFAGDQCDVAVFAVDRANGQVRELRDARVERLAVGIQDKKIVDFSMIIADERIAQELYPEMGVKTLELANPVIRDMGPSQWMVECSIQLPDGQHKAAFQFTRSPDKRILGQLKIYPLD
jgi:hypothetical protein